MPDPNNVALPDHGIVFMLIPKVANTSMKIAIAQALGQTLHDIHAPNHFHYIDTHEAMMYPYRVAFVRDPLVRLASCYRDKICGNPPANFMKTLERMGIRKDMHFRPFIETVAQIPDEQCVGAAQHFRSMSYSLCDGDRLIPNVIGRFETLSQDWDSVRGFLSDQCHLQLPPLRHTRQTKLGVAHYCPKGRSFALQRYRDDVRLFGYRPARMNEIDPDNITCGRSICNVHREAYQIARDRVEDTVVSVRLMALIAEAFDMGKRMNAKLRGSQYEA